MSRIGPRSIGAGSGIFAGPIVAALAGFTPASAAGLQLWFRSDTAVSGGAQVSGWGDISGNARHATAAASPPVLVSADLNGFNAIKFDGAANRMDTGATFVIPQPNTVFIVAKMNAIADDALYFGANAVSLGFLTRSAAQYVQHDSNVADGAAVSAAVSAYRLITGVFDGASSRIAINNEAFVSSGTNFTSSFASGVNIASQQGVRLGSVSIVEIVHYNTAVTGATLASVQQYFQDRYALW